MVKEKNSENKQRFTSTRVFDRRKAQKIQDTAYISMPKEYAEKEEIEQGTEMAVLADSIFLAIPERMTKKEVIKQMKKMTKYIEEHTE